MSDVLASIATDLATFGVSLVENTRLSFAPAVLKALSLTPVDTGRVVVLCKGTPKVVSDRFANLTPDEAKLIQVVSCDGDYAKVRPHVISALNTRKVKHATTKAMKDAEGLTYGFGITRK